jgi:hypothetical protein
MSCRFITLSEEHIHQAVEQFLRSLSLIGDNETVFDVAPNINDDEKFDIELKRE